MTKFKVEYKLGEIVQHRLNDDKLQVIGYDIIEGGPIMYICLHADASDKKYMYGAELKGGNKHEIGFIIKK